MSEAKKKTDRWDNSVNWSIMAEEHSLSSKLLTFEKPLYIDETNTIEFTDESEKNSFGWDKLLFKKYMDLCTEYSGISSSHLHQIVKKAIEFNDDVSKFEKWLMLLDSEEEDKSFSGILRGKVFRSGTGELMINRIMTLFELLSIKRNINNEQK